MGEDGQIKCDSEEVQEWISPEDKVSMNMWAGYPEFLDFLAEDFKDFLANVKEGDLKSEYLLPNIVDKLLNLASNYASVITVVLAGKVLYAVVYEQYQDGGYDTEDRGALWLLHGGNSSRGCVKIATVKGVHCFESIYPFSGYYLDIENTNSWALAGAFLPATMHLHCNNVNPAYYGFSSMESNIIVSEAVEDFVDPEAETTTED